MSSSKTSGAKRSSQLFLKPLTGKVKPKPFAVFDIETTVNLERAFMLGFYDGHTYKLFESWRKTISQPCYPEDAAGPVSQFMTWLTSTNQYCDRWIYAHNGGNFDFLYLIRWLISHSEEYSFNVVPLQSSILCLEVAKKVERRKTPLTWTFLDSYRLMNAPLDKLAKALLGVGKTVKCHLDGTHVNEDVQAEVERYYKTLHRNPQRYEYLRTDCVRLYDSLAAFREMITGLGGDIGMTAPSSAMKSFRRMHLDKWIPINAHFPECDCER